MIKIKKSLKGIVAFAIMSIFGIAFLVGCNKEENTVTFVIDGKNQAVEIGENGSVKKPQDPEKEYYSFVGWYTDTNYTTEYDFSHPKGGTSAYAYFVPVKTTLHVNSDAARSVDLADLDSLTEEYEADALKSNLSFDGWYINADFTTKYTSYKEQNAGNLYGQYLAEVVFDNGYEEIYSIKLGIGKSLADVIGGKPDEVVDGFVKDYMSKDDIFYVYADEPILKDANGNYKTDEDGNYIYNDVDFTKPIEGNQRIKVQWHSPSMSYSHFQNNPNYYCSNIKSNTQEVKDWQALNPGLAWNEYFGTFNVISFGSRVWLKDANGDPYIVNVTSVRFNSTTGIIGAAGSIYKNANTIIFQDGIEYIEGINGCGSSISGSIVNNITIPDTVRVIYNSLNGFTNLSKLELPSSLEVIGGSLSSNINSSMINSLYGQEEAILGYDFDVVIPKSVKYMFIMPTNLKFEQGSTFFVEDDVLYQNTDNGLVYVYSTKLDQNGDLHIKEGVKGIQNAALYFVYGLNNVYLPSTWEFVNFAYGFDRYKLPYSIASQCPFMVDNPTAETVKTVNQYGYTIGNTTNATRYIFDTTEYPTNVPEYAFYQYDTNPEYYFSKMAFVAPVESGNVLVNYVSTNTNLKEIGHSKATTTGSFAMEANEVLTLEDFLYYLDLDANTIRVKSIKELGNEYTFGNKLIRNIYIEFEYEFAGTGFTYAKIKGKNEATVTGFDKNTASKLEGLFFVNILDEVEIDGVKYPVTEINEEAFKDASAIAIVFIGENVKVIGKKAFYNCNNLENVIFKTRVLEEIRESAFENTIIKTIAVPLANMKNIEPYAFKNRTLTTFAPVEDEKEYQNHVMANVLWNWDYDAELVEGKYYFICQINSIIFGIVKYTGTYKTKTMTLTEYNANGLNGEKTVDVDGYDFDLVATAGGFNNRYGMPLGYSWRASSQPKNATAKITRFTIKTGSMYYLSYVNANNGNDVGIPLVFVNVKKIEENAITDATDAFRTIKENATTGVKTSSYVQRYENSRMNYSATQGGGLANIYDCWLTEEQISSIASKDYNFDAEDAIFEDGWFNGWKTTDADYEEKMEFMKYSTKQTSI